MKKFVKLFVVLLAVCMVLSIFAACGKKDPKPSGDDKPVDNNPVDDNPHTPADDNPPAHEHAWDEGKVTKDPTCTEAGEKVYTCECGETKTEAIAALGHVWNEGEVTKEASIDAEGEKTFTCTVCGETKVEVIEKLPLPEDPDPKGTQIEVNGAIYASNGDFTYTYLYLDEYDEEATELVIPAYVNGMKVVAVQDYAFASTTQKFTKLTIEDGIQVIGESAFEGFSALTELVIPDSVTEIGENAFKGCTSLRSVKLGAGTNYIPSNAFANCAKIEFLDLGDGLYEVDNATFLASLSTLVKVVIGKNMVDLKGSFETAADVKLVVVEDNSDAGVIAGTNVKAILDKIADAKLADVEVRVEIDKDGYVFYFDEKGEVSLMGYIGGGQKADPEDDDEVIDPAKKVLRLPEGAGEEKLPYVIYRYAFFQRSDIERVIFSDYVTGIGDLAFCGSSIKTINLSKSVKEIGSRFLSSCNSLTTITVDAGNTVYSAAGNCLIKTADKTVIAGCKASVIPTDALVVTKIGERAFEEISSLTAIAIPANVTEIKALAFTQCTSLATINYAGTRTAWVALVKGTNWDYNTGAYTVVCSNGNLCKTHNFSAGTMNHFSETVANYEYYYCTVCQTYFDAGQNVTDYTAAAAFDK